MLVKLLKELFWGRKVATLLPQNKEKKKKSTHEGERMIFGLLSLANFT
jgi:hypothetical protein